MAYDVLCLQNIRLAKQQLSQLADMNSHFDVIGTDSVDFEHEMLKGRRYGGTAIFWSNSLSVHSIVKIIKNNLPCFQLMTKDPFLNLCLCTFV